MKAIKYILASVLLVNTGNLVTKYGLQRYPFQFDAILTSYVNLFTSPFIILGLAAIGVSSIFWLAALSKAELSYAYPMISIGYIITAIASWIFFEENLTLMRMAGIFIICSGVFLMSKSEAKK